MRYEISHICQVETRRCIWLVGLVFAVVFMVQYFELPYGDVISSIFSDGNAKVPVNGSSLDLAPEKAKELVDNFSVHNISTNKDSSLSSTEPEEDIAPTSRANGNPDTISATPPFALPQVLPPPPLASLTDANTNIQAPLASSSTSNMSVDKFEPKTLDNDEELGSPKSDGDPLSSNTSTPKGPTVTEIPDSLTDGVVTISNMNDMLLRSRATSYSSKPRWSSAVDQRLIDARYQIENAPPVMSKDHGVYAPLYRNISMFRRSYELMEKTLKVYIYKEGKRPVFHQPPLKGIYASEGWFMKLLKANKQFVTKNARDAHLFYLPFSSRMLEETLYVPDSHSHKNLIEYLESYLDLIIAKYPFWNRTGGADHFLVACHDWAPAETELRMSNCIRALCNADMKDGFKLGKDVSLPETNVRATTNLLRDIGGNAPSQRPILAFFAGQMHGELRSILLQNWQNKDPDIKVFNKLPKSKNNRNYVRYMKTSKYCICAKGYEVNSPRVVEAIFFECVPVIISDNFVPPFFEILNWESFAVFVLEKDVPNLKNILLSITDGQYRVMQQRVKQVQQHFLWHVKPVKYDIFHMILHSIWYNRVLRVV